MYVVVLFVFVVLFAMLRFVLPFGVRFGARVRGVVPSRVVWLSPPYRRLLAISALISASEYFRLVPPRLSICSSIASATALLCAALGPVAMCTDLLDLMCLPVPSCNMPFRSSSSGCFLLTGHEGRTGGGGAAAGSSGCYQHRQQKQKDCGSQTNNQGRRLIGSVITSALTHYSVVSGIFSY
jgi:hypothetical protein